MTSDRAREANRRNAQLSTGPRTAEGRAVSSQNALRHGILSDRATSASEDTELYQALLAGLRNEFGPRSPLETLLVERLANLFWRERRLAGTEVLLLNNIDENATNPFADSSPTRTLSLVDQLLLGRYQTMLTNQINATIAQLKSLSARDVMDGRV